MQSAQIAPDDPRYPPALKQFLANAAPRCLYALGNFDILKQETLALFCSTRCPGDLILKTYDLAQHLRDAGITVISGFHSPMERECLTILLRGKQSVVVCPARSLNRIRLPEEYKKAMNEGRLLLLSPFRENERRSTEKIAVVRNLFVAALAHSIFVSYAEPNSKTEELCRRMVGWQKPLFTFESDPTKNLIQLGAKPIHLENLRTELGEFLHL